MWYLFWYKSERDMVEDKVFWGETYRDVEEAKSLARAIEDEYPGSVTLIIPEGDVV